MTSTIMQQLQVDRQTADRLRQQYWLRYGATLIGLERHHHDIDLQAFLDESHEFETATHVRAPRGLTARLRRLPGRKVLVTNAPARYARRVLKHLRLLPAFEGIWSLEDMRTQGTARPKPSQTLLRYILPAEGVAHHQAVLDEDTLVNLKSARACGLRTVHVFHPG